MNPFPAARRDIVFVQRRLTTYRVRLFESLRADLQGVGLRLIVIAGEGFRNEEQNRDRGELPWAVTPRDLTLEFGGTGVWFPLRLKNYLRFATALILPHELRQLALWREWMSSPSTRRYSVCLFGHGRNFQGSETGVSKWLRVKSVAAADWWFAYTEASRHVLAEQGYPVTRITVVNNATDTSVLAVNRAEISSRPKSALVLGTLHRLRRLPFLLSALDLIRVACPNFEAHFVGGGSGERDVRHYMSSRPWVHFHGYQTGKQLAAIANRTSVALNAGMLGLNFLDACALGLPTVIVRDQPHSPEIAYFADGTNGIVTDDFPASFANGALRLLTDDRERERLAAAAVRTSESYSIVGMSRNFTQGIEQCLRTRHSVI